MNINNFVILPDSKPGTSVRLKAKTVRELQLEKAHLEMENEEMEKKLRQLQSNLNREKQERKRSSAYHWKSGRAGPVTTQARVLSQSKEHNNKVSSGKVKLQILKEQIKEPAKEPFKREIASAVVCGKPGLKGIAQEPYEIKSALLTEAHMHVGKLEVADHFVEGINLNELKINQERKTVNSKHQELSSASTCTSTEYHNKGLLLNGTFNEKESAESFQEALLQWRKGNCHHREQLCASSALPESVRVCEVQTNLTVMKTPIQIAFKTGGLSYMEKLLLKKYRRALDDQISVSRVKDLRPVQTLNVHEAMIERRREGDDDNDVDDLTVEEVKRYCTSVFRKEVPDTVPASAESSLKIKFIDESYDKDLEESYNFLVMEAGAIGMNNQGKADPLKQCRRNPVSSKEVSQEKMAVCSLQRSVVRKESIKAKTMERSLTSSELPEKISNPTELMSNKFLLEAQLQKTHKDFQELDSVCNSQSSVLPVITKSSLLQDIAKRQKSVSSWYCGFEGFFVGVNPKRVVLEACSSLCADSIPVDFSILFPGDGKWFIERSLNEYADDSVVQGVLESQLNRPSSGLDAQVNESRGSWSTNMPHCKVTGNCPTSTQPKLKSSLVHTWRVNTEIPKHKCNDVIEQGDYLWECDAEQIALLTLEKELQSYTGPEKNYCLTSEDVTSSIRSSEKTGRITTDFNKILKLADHTGLDTFRDWDDQMDDEEEILEDKKQVLALQ